MTRTDARCRVCACELCHPERNLNLTLLHSKRPKFYGVLAVLSAIGLTYLQIAKKQTSLRTFQSNVRK